MALNIIINKVSVAASFAAGATVATAVASGGTAPYIYSLAIGGDKFAINSSTGVVTTIAAMDINNIASFSVTATDSTTGTALTGTSSVTYPPIQSAIQNRFNKPNTIYKVTKDITLSGGTLTIPAGCTLDFQGGSFTNGTIVGNNTKIKAGLQRIFNIDITLSGKWNIEGIYAEWFGAINDKGIDSYPSLNATVVSCDEIEVPLLMNGNSIFMVTQPLVLPRFGVIGGDHNKCAIYAKISNETSDTVAFTYGKPNDYSYRSVIRGVTFGVYDPSTSVCNVLKVCTPSRGAKMEDCTLYTGAGSCLVFSSAYYYELNNVCFCGKWQANPTGDAYKGIGFSFGQDGEINNIAFNKCDFKDLLCFCYNTNNAFAGSNTISVNDTAIERMGEGLGDLSSLGIIFNNCYLEAFCLNATQPNSYSVAFTGALDVEFNHCLLNFGNKIPLDKPLFTTQIGRVVMRMCSASVPEGFNSYIINPLNYSSKGTLVVQDQDSFVSWKGESITPVYKKLLQQHFTYDRSSDAETVYSYGVSEAELAYRTIERITRRGSGIYNQNSHWFGDRRVGTLMFYDKCNFFMILEGELHIKFNDDSNNYIYLRQKVAINIKSGTTYTEGEPLTLNILEENKQDSSNYLPSDYKMYSLNYLKESNNNPQEKAFTITTNKVQLTPDTGNIKKDIYMTTKFRMIAANSEFKSTTITLV